MGIDKGDFDAVTEDDLQELVTAGVPEGLRLEYKRGTYGNADDDKREFLKDVSAFANSHGGHLILGIDEASGVATNVVGLGTVDANAELLRLEQIARNGLEPAISGLRMKAIPLAAGGHAIVLRVPRSWHPPHRVIARRSNRFYARHSNGVYQPDVEGLRTLFTQSASALDRAKQFRTERLHDILRGAGEHPLENDGRLILHIIPMASFFGAVTFNLEDVYEKQGNFPPIGGGGWNPRFNYYGVVNERGGLENSGYTQVFRDGAIEATKANIIQNKGDLKFIPGVGFERDIFDVLHRYIMGIRELGVPPPLIIMFTIDGVRGIKYWATHKVAGELPKDTLILPECIIDEYGEEVDHHRAVRPAFDVLWNAIGYSASQFFNDEGLWVGDTS